MFGDSACRLQPEDVQMKAEGYSALPAASRPAATTERARPRGQLRRGEKRNWKTRRCVKVGERRMPLAARRDKEVEIGIFGPPCRRARMPCRRRTVTACWPLDPLDPVMCLAHAPWTKRPGEANRESPSEAPRAPCHSDVAEPWSCASSSAVTQAPCTRHGKVPVHLY